MPRSHSWKLRWNLFAMGLLITAAVVALLALLTLAWSFDLETSPTWQVAAYHLLLTLLFSSTLVIASHRPYHYGKMFPGAMLAMALAVPTVVFTILWVKDGAYLGFRDPRIFQAVAISILTYIIIWALAVIPYTLYLLGRDLPRVWRRGQPGED